MARLLRKLSAFGLLLLPFVSSSSQLEEMRVTSAPPVLTRRVDMPQLTTTTTTTTTTAPARHVRVSTEESEHAAHFEPGSVEQLIVDVFGDAAPQALKVASCESHYNPDAVNGRYRGVFQIGDMHAAEWLEVTGTDYWTSWMDPVANITYAHALWSRAGWAPWSCAA